MYCFSRFLIVFMLLLQVILGDENRVVLVTGGAGYIGSHTCKALKDAGFIPVTYDSLALGDRGAVKWGPLVVGDLLDIGALEKVFAEYKPIAVIHFAALRSVRESVRNPSLYYTNNVVGSINLLNAMLKYHVKQLIFSSSCTVYGNSHISPVSELCPKSPTNPYASSKYMVESIIKDYAHVNPLKYMILRYFNAAGVDVEAGLKRSKHSLNFLIPQAMLALMHQNSPMQLFGTDYPTPDGTAIRDYVHVKDLAAAHVLALNHLLEGKTNNEINLGTGKGYSVLEIIRAIEKVGGKSVPYDVRPCGEGELPETVAKIDKAKEILHFQPRYSELQTIIESEWESLQKIEKEKTI